MRHETGFRVEAVSLVRLAGLAQGTRVATPGGEVPVERLVRGDRVVTKAGPLRMIVAEARSARVAPVRIAPGALGGGLPAREMVVGPATRVWVKGQTKPYEARLLVDGRDVTFDEAKPMMVWTLVFPTPQVVRAEGVEVCV